jgi:large subunit ribosomal protein L29
MANIVQLRELNNEQLQEKMENGREEMFNLRFQNAAARLTDTTRLRTVRREIAQIQTLLHQRQAAIQMAAAQPEVATAIAGRKWAGAVNFSYEESAWIVKFGDENGSELATTRVNLNKRQPRTRRERRR